MIALHVVDYYIIVFMYANTWRFQHLTLMLFFKRNRLRSGISISPK